MITFFGCSTNNTESEITATLDKPHNLQASYKTHSNQIVINWSKVDAAENYLLYRSVNDSLNFMLLNTVADTIYNDTAVTTSLMYYYKVQARNQSGYSIFSNLDSGAIGTLKYRIKRELFYETIPGYSGYKISNKCYYLYSDSNVLTRSIDSAYVSDGIYRYRGKTDFFYDSQNLLFQKIQDGTYGENHSYILKTNYTYKQGLQDCESRMSWDSIDSVWHDDWFIVNYYSPQNQLAKRIHINDDDVSEESLYYTQLRLDSIILDGLDGNKRYKHQYSYDSQSQVKKIDAYFYAEGWHFFYSRNYEYETYVDNSKTSHKNQNNQIIFNHEPLRLVK